MTRPPSLSGPVLEQALAQATADLGAGRADAARELLAQLRRAAPDAARVHFLSGLAAVGAGDPSEAANHFRAALDRDPDDATARGWLAQALLETGHDAGAAPLVDGIGTDAPLPLAMARAQWLLRHSRLKEAAGLLDETASRFPEQATVQALLAETLERQNQLAEAEVAATAALALSPGDLSAVTKLARIERRTERAAAARARLTDVLATHAGTPPGARGAALVELGFAADRDGDADAAFAAFVEGQALLARTPEAAGADPEAVFRLIEALAAVPMPPAAAPDPDTPVFLVGFPRSGTTLTEQLLAAHPRLITTDEQPFLPDLFADWPALTGGPYPHRLSDLDAAACESLRGRYRNALHSHFGAALDGRRAVDKLPLNLLHLPLVRRLFPGAPVILALRDPRDVVLSCLMQQFAPNAAMAPFFALDSTARFYAAAMDLWRGWRDAMDPPVLESRYEDVVADVEAAARRLITHVGEAWSPAVLDYAEAAQARAISTPSYRDVTGPIHQRASGRWRRYEKHLAPVLGILDPYVRAFGYAPASETGGGER